MVSGLKIFATSNVTYGRDYLYLQFRIVKHASIPTAIKLTVERNVSTIFSELLETNFETIKWTDNAMAERSCAETSNKTCASVLDIQVSKYNVSCTDTGTYRGLVEFDNGQNRTDQVFVEVEGKNTSVKFICLLHQPALQIQLSSL